MAMLSSLFISTEGSGHKHVVNIGGWGLCFCGCLWLPHDCFRSASEPPLDVCLFFGGGFAHSLLACHEFELFEHGHRLLVFYRGNQLP